MSDYLPYCHADPCYYENPGRIDDTGSRFAVTRRPAPPGWRRSEVGLWVVLVPQQAKLPAQGWKIHVSATMADVSDVLDRVWEYCVTQHVAVKFVRSRRAAFLANAKDNGRAASGKLVTIYPVDTAELAKVLTDLGTRLTGFPGPYILSDVRIGAGPLFVRYGAFNFEYCSTRDGDLAPALHTPDGELVPDRRGPVFDLPGWVEVPEPLVPHVAARRSGDFGDFPYRISKALHFSNAGGIYLAEHRHTGEQVVLREARPHAGLDRTGADAVARLHVEQSTLAKLADLPCVPAVVGHHVAWEHHFLAEEHVEGLPLLADAATRNPFSHIAPTSERFAEYEAWALTILSKVEQAIAAVHANGMWFGDLHPGNIIVRPDGEVMLVDFESAAAATVSERRVLGVPGFAAPAEVSGFDVDHHALDCLRLWLFLPLTQLVPLAPAKAATLHQAARARFPSMPPLGPSLRTEAHQRPDEAAALFSGELSWPALRDSLVAGIHAAATPDRTDRLFPGDPAQFHTAGVALASGASGVLLALHRVGATVPDEYVDWLVRAARRSRVAGGLYDGLHGVALALDVLGRHDEAQECLDRALVWPGPPNATLFGGLAGAALNLLYFANRTGDEKPRDTAIQLADELAVLVRAGESHRLRPPTRAGLLRGMTGSALLFVRLFEATGASSYLDLAEAALRQDLAHCVTLEDGGRYLRHGAKSFPGYLDAGSGGIALVIGEYLRYRENAELSAEVEAILLTCRSELVLEPGLHQGKAGMIALLRLLGTPADQASVAMHVRRLGWHALSHNGNLVFPGSKLLRVSLDLATGSAGILLALHVAFTGAGSVVADPGFLHSGQLRGGELHGSGT